MTLGAIFSYASMLITASSPGYTSNVTLFTYSPVIRSMAFRFNRSAVVEVASGTTGCVRNMNKGPPALNRMTEFTVAISGTGKLNAGCEGLSFEVSSHLSDTLRSRS